MSSSLVCHSLSYTFSFARPIIYDNNRPTRRQERPSKSNLSLWARASSSTRCSGEASSRASLTTSMRRWRLPFVLLLGYCQQTVFWITCRLPPYLLGPLGVAVAVRFSVADLLSPKVNPKVTWRPIRGYGLQAHRSLLGAFRSHSTFDGVTSICVPALKADSSPLDKAPCKQRVFRAWHTSPQ